MAGLLTGKGKDLIGWQGTRELIAAVELLLAKQLGRYDEDGEMCLLHTLADKLSGELAFEEGFAERFALSLNEFEACQDESELPEQWRRLQDLIAEQFQRRSAVIVCHALCSTVRMKVVAKVLELAEKWMEKNGLGSTPSAYCCLAGGPLGRQEEMPYSELETILVYAEDGKSAASYFLGLCRKVAAILVQLGITNGDMSFTSHLWRGSLSEWRQRFTDGSYDMVPLADLSLIHGDKELAATTLNLVGAVQALNRSTLGVNARRVSTMPGGLDFFGRFRMEKSSGHKLVFPLEKYALLPLVANVRILAIRDGIRETSTLNRIRRLVEAGSLNVEMSERLMRAFHEIETLQIREELLVRGRRAEIDAVQLADETEYRLKSALESISNLQKIVYSHFMDQG